ncbi:MAG: hypothetical protein M1473_03960 [Firmicutes bacterium]|nr:hypothetical protein [Bacillota bacterium]
MSEQRLAEATALELEFERLAAAEELDDTALASLLEQREALHRKMGADIDAEPSLLPSYQPLLRRAYENMQKLMPRLERERTEVQDKLITLNTSKKARKAY